ncbi:helix-turn-helix domain-containing protein [Myroides odoratimimus]|uniref:helix-turn-helix domain-containing protein n=1 Tax=Myroides odoratimimus TaxID=76832 RepID=UPI0025778E36|nr:helix-turn-helix domain-containing protein [Myroides odoratimimus]MDM1464039.1 helix-turn-helix domain-containing protein [Myroides odoratimimus]MDM1473899.1 helix-turn-helix domain-containing protein [Myroides odoratimimus]
MNEGFWSILTAEVRYDKRLKPNAKLLYSEISALTSRDGYCWAKNEYFAELYDVSPETISRWISQLKKYGYLLVEIENKSGGFERKIRLDISGKAPCHFEQTALTKKTNRLDENVNIIIHTNNTINNKGALEFLKENSFSLYENFEMRFKKQISDFPKFCELFDLKFDEENLEYTVKKINSRLTRFAINYCDNERKGYGGNQQQVEQPVVQSYSKNTF